MQEIELCNQRLRETNSEINERHYYDSPQTKHKNQPNNKSLNLDDLLGISSIDSVHTLPVIKSQNETYLPVASPTSIIDQLDKTKQVRLHYKVHGTDLFYFKKVDVIQKKIVDIVALRNTNKQLNSTLLVNMQEECKNLRLLSSQLAPRVIF